MKLRKETLEELGIILNEEFGVNLTKSEVEKIGISLVGYFELLLKGEKRGVRNSSIQPH